MLSRAMKTFIKLPQAILTQIHCMHLPFNAFKSCRKLALNWEFVENVENIRNVGNITGKEIKTAGKTLSRPI